MTASPPNTLQPAMAGLLCYLLMPLFCGWPIPGVLMLVIEKTDRFVRFHAWQSIALGAVVWGGSLLCVLMGVISGLVADFMADVFGFLRFLLWCTGVVIWIVCMVRARRQQTWRIPFLGGWAAQRAGLDGGS